MEIVIVDDYRDLSQVSSQKIKDIILQKNGAVLGLATGSTPVGMYKKLIQYHQKEELDFSNVVTFNLDEYVGISPNHPQSYHKFMYDNLFDHINVLHENIHIPQGDKADLVNECRQYELQIRQAGGIDVQVLGIGSNGHIGFNEPGSDPEDRTRVVELAENTIKANARFFSGEELVPRLAVSMGIKTILESSKHIILLASGKEKADAVSKMVKGEMTSDLPASLLQSHQNVTVIADKEAAAKLN